MTEKKTLQQIALVLVRADRLGQLGQVMVPKYVVVWDETEAELFCNYHLAKYFADMTGGKVQELTFI